MGDLLQRQLGLAAHLHATGDRRRAARFGALLNQGAFQFRQYPDHLPHRAACGDGGVNGFRQRARATSRALISPRRPIRSRSKRPSRSGFQTMRVSPTASVLRHWVRSVYLTCAPVALSIKISLHPTFFKAISGKSEFWSSVEIRA